MLIETKTFVFGVIGMHVKYYHRHFPPNNNGKSIYCLKEKRTPVKEKKKRKKRRIGCHAIEIRIPNTIKEVLRCSILF